VGIDADARAAGGDVFCDCAGAGGEVICGVFGVDATFDRDAFLPDVALAQVDFFTSGDSYLPFYQVVACNHFGDGVLDLDTGVDLDEVEFFVFVEEKFDGGGVDIVCLFDNPQSGIAEGFFSSGVEDGTG